MRQHQLTTVVAEQRGCYSTDILVNTAWNFTYTALWNESIFSCKESEASKKLIRLFLVTSKDSYKAYLAFVQRVLLTRHYVMANSSRFVPLPSIWLDKNNSNGFAGTKEWFDHMQAVRASVPSHKIELKAFAEAILEMSQERTCRNYQYWRNYFIERKTPGLLNLFLNTIANQHYKL